jgi:hypothetical protein
VTTPYPPLTTPHPQLLFFVTFKKRIFKKKKKRGRVNPHKTPTLKQHSPKGGFRV